MFNYQISPESFANQILMTANVADEIVVNPDELAMSLFHMKVIYSDNLRVNYEDKCFEIPFKYMGNKAVERFAITLLLFKMYYSDDGKDANTTMFDMTAANEFISTILMPEKEFTRLYSVLTKEELAKVFGVTETFVRYRADCLNLLNS
jgi:hypothetical protein